MKTLLDRMESQLDSNLYLTHNFNEIEKEFLRLTKEWLKEIKQLELCNEVFDSKKRTGVEMITFLLKKVNENEQKN